MYLLQSMKVLTGIGLAFSVSAAAQTNEHELGQFSDWQAIHYVEDGQRVCSMWSDPIQRGDHPSRGDAHAFIAHRGSEHVHEVSLQFGVDLKARSTVVAAIGKQRFKLYVDGDGAWNPSLGEDQRMVDAMRRGANLVVSASTADGRKLKDTYSLSGFTAAHKAIGKACNIKS
jgi:hypothetical protein